MATTYEFLQYDYARMQPGRKYSIPRLIDSCLTNPGMLACTLFRFQSYLYYQGRFRLAAVIRVLNNAWTGADIVPGCTAGPGLLLPHPTGVVVGHGVVLGRDCTLLQNTTLGEKFADGQPPHDYPTIGDSVVVGAGASILGGVTVGANSRIAANAVVLRDVPAGSVAVGAPARIVDGEKATK